MDILQQKNKSKPQAIETITEIRKVSRPITITNLQLTIETITTTITIIGP